MAGTGTTLYARAPRWLSRALLACVLLLAILPARPHPHLFIPGERQWGSSLPQSYDVKLYKSIVADIAHGQGYYQAAAAEHRRLHFPTFPPEVFRLPTLAWILAGLHFYALGLACLLGLYAMIMLLFYRQLPPSASLAQRIASMAALTTGLSIVGIAESIYLHEVWAALLLGLSLLSYRSDRWWPALLLGVIACLIREIAAPYLFVMGGFALCEKRWRQSLAWFAAILLVVLVLARHYQAAAALYRPGDLVSANWLAFGGWDFAIATAKWNVVFHALPYPLIALAICMGVLGLAGSDDGRARRAAVVIACYLAGFLIVGRPENYYWGLLYAPLLPVGILLAPAAFKDLFHGALMGTHAMGRRST